MKRSGEETFEAEDALIYKDGEHKHFLPDFDPSTITKQACIIAVLVGALLCITCFVLASAIFATYGNEVLGHFLHLSPSGAEVIALTVNFVLTLCLEGLAFIHATSLRWALYKEDRLEFNTNLRLLTSARISKPNKWYINALSAACLILCYAATSQIFLTLDPKEKVDGVEQVTFTTIVVNPVALIVLGIGLLVYTVIAVWCLASNLRQCPTWSSSPMTNTLAALHQRLTHHPNRCMMPVHSKLIPSQPMAPSPKQQPLQAALPGLKYLTTLIWALTFLSFAWFLSMIFVSRSIRPGGAKTPWHFTMSWSIVWDGGYADPINSVPISMFSYGSGNNTYTRSTARNVQYLYSILFLVAIQGLQTIGLHCIELVVNANRDEDIWRRAAVPPFTTLFPSSPQLPKRFALRRHHGIPLTLSSIASAATSAPYLYLLTMKASLHWSLGQSVLPTYSSGNIVFYMTYGRIFVYLLLVISLANFTQYMCLRRPDGPQPAAWGHLQTLADLVDDWGREDAMGGGRVLFWGDKGVSQAVGGEGEEEGVRHAGTAGERGEVGDVAFGAFYEGGGRRGSGEGRRRRKRRLSLCVEEVVKMAI
ncbi:MAG: hypothetical protein Q9227_005248 [Pyrenula ochraceoflavens]